MPALLGWAVFVAALTVYLFFPYQKALRLALQNVLGSGRIAVSMEGVTTKLMGIGASKVYLKPDGAKGQTAPFELVEHRHLLEPAVAFDREADDPLEGIPLRRRA